MKRINVIFLLFLANIFYAEGYLKIGIISPYTGEAFQDHLSGQQVFDLCIEQINEKGILGKKLKVVKYDNRSSSLGSKLAAQKAVRDSVIAIIGPTWSSFSLAACPILQKAKIPTISDMSTNPDVTKIGDYIFRVCYTDEFQGKIMARFALNDLKKTNASILIDSDSKYSSDLASFFEKEYLNLGGQIASKHYFRSNSKNFNTQILKIKETSPDLLILPIYSKEAGIFLKQMQKLDLNLPVIGADGFTKDIYKYSGKITNSVYYSTLCTLDRDTKELVSFKSRYKKKYGSLKNLKAYSLLTRDAVYLLKTAIETAGTVNKKMIRNALCDIRDFEGLSGNISFKNSRDPKRNAVINKLENNKVIFYKFIE